MFWVIAGELEKYATMKALTVQVYERAVGSKSVDPFTLRNFQYSPTSRLVKLYVRDGRKDDARRVLLELNRPHDFPNYDQDYINQMKMQGLAAAVVAVSWAGVVRSARTSARTSQATPTPARPRV